MIRPQKNWQQLVKQAEAKRIGDMNAQAFSVIASINNYLRQLVPSIYRASPTRQEQMLGRVAIKVGGDYADLLRKYKQDIIDSLNRSSIEQRFLVVNTLGAEPEIEPFPFYTEFPRRDEFAITRRILSDRSITFRSRKMANDITKVIKQSNEAGLSINRTTRQIEITLGLRSRDGMRMTDKGKRLLKSGKFSHTNGHFYDFYRIARTETMRMSSIQSNNQFRELVQGGEDARLQMVSVIDSRTREQSVEMNGQLSREDGKFKYPNGFYYLHGEAPMRYSINDRESVITVFLDDLKRGDKVYKTIQGYERSL